MNLDDLLGSSPGVFLGVTVVLAGLAAWLTGRAIAESWRPVRQVLFACVGLTIAARFLTFALFQGPLTAPLPFLVGYAVLAAIALVAYRVTLVARMVRQYPWRYRRTSPFAYVEVSADPEARR